MPVAASTAHLRPTEQFLSPAGGDLRTEGLLAPASRTRGLGQRMHSEDAEGAHRDERAVGQRDQRYQRPDGYGNHPGESGWRATGTGWPIWPMHGFMQPGRKSLAVWKA